MKVIAKKIIKKINKFNPFEFLNLIDKNSQGMNSILSYLNGKKEDVTAGELAVKINVSTARIAVLLKKLVKMDLITKSVSNQDARVTIVSITEKGKKYIEKETEKSVSIMQKILKKVDPKEIDEFIRIAIKINKSICD